MKTLNESQDKALSSAISLLEKKYGKGAIMSLDEDAVEKVEAISTGSLGLEAASRGAKEVYLFDKSEVTFPLLKETVHFAASSVTVEILDKSALLVFK